MKKNWKVLAAVFSLIGMTIFGSCNNANEPDGPDNEQDSTRIVLEGTIKESLTLESDQKYLIRGFVYIDSAAVLTIQPGTVIFGERATKGSLIIRPKAKIIAQGTAQNPIVFTSDQPVGQRSYGDWGGIVVCGRAKVNTVTGIQEVEGVPGTTYGGNDDNDNSGVLKYVRIEFAGIPYEADKEINGITFGGVGRTTVIENIQVSYCGDDSFEWFGGTVNAKRLIAYKGWDDEFDTDYGYSGKLQFLVGIRDSLVADKSGSNGFESDNDASGSSNQPFTQPVFSNVTLIGPFTGTVIGREESKVLYTTQNGKNGAIGGKFQAAMHLRRNTKLNVHNSIFIGWPYGLRTSDSKGSANSESVVKNILLAGMWKDFYAAEDQTKFETVGWNNTSGLSTKDIIADNQQFWMVNTARMAGTDFNGLDTWFTNVSYKGAFDGTQAGNWTQGWTNFDPQNTAY